MTDFVDSEVYAPIDETPSLGPSFTQIGAQELQMLKDQHASLAALLTRLDDPAKESPAQSKEHEFNRISARSWVHKDLKQAFVTIYDPALEGRFTANVVVRVGARFEHDAIAGIAHYLEHCIYLGSRRFPTPTDLALALLRTGGDYSGETGMETTGYSLDGNEDRMEEAIHSLVDKVFFPRLTNDTEREKEVVLAELEEDFDPDGQLIFAPTILYKMLFGSHPAANLVTGTKASVQGITPAMLRAFHRRFYTPRNSLIVISSSRPHQQVAELLNQTVVPEMLVLQKSLDQDKASGANAKSKVWKYVRDNTRTFAAFDVSTQLYLAATDERIILEERNTDSSTISLQLQAMLPKMDSFKYSGAYRILTNVLFDSTLSMVFGDCRKAGLLYKIDGWMETRSDGTFFNLTFDVVPANLDKVVKKIAMALRKIAAGPDGVKDDFFQLAKQRAMYEFRKRSSDSSAWVASEVDNFGYWGHGKFQRDRGAQRQRTLDKIEQATKEDLVALARLVRASPRVAIYTEGPIANRRAFRNQIQQGFQAMLDVQKLVE